MASSNASIGSSAPTCPLASLFSSSTWPSTSLRRESASSRRWSVAEASHSNLLGSSGAMTYMSSAAAISSLTPLGSCSSPAADSPAAIRSRNAIRREYFSAARWLRAALALRFAELDSADLASQRLRELVHELDPPRVGVGREMTADEPLDLIPELVRGLGALGEDDECLDDVAAALVGGGHGGGLEHRRVLDARRLHLEGADPVAGRD